MATTYTSWLRLRKNDFRDIPWADDVNMNWDDIDAALKGIASSVDFNLWENSHLYSVGAVVIDNSTAPSTQWLCNVGNTSSPLPITFAQERIAHPTYWSRVPLVIRPRGIWANDTAYDYLDITYDPVIGVTGLCKTPHVSSSSPNDITDDAVYWDFLVDLTAMGVVQAINVSFNNATTAFSGGAANVQVAIEKAKVLIDGLQTQVSGNLVLFNSLSAAVANDEAFSSATRTLVNTHTTQIGTIQAIDSVQTNTINALVATGQHLNLTQRPQGRISFTSGVAVQLASVAAGLKVYFVQDRGHTTSIPNTPGADHFPELENVLANSTVNHAGPAAAAANSIYDLFVWLDTVLNQRFLTRGPAWTNNTTRSAGTALNLSTIGLLTNSVNITNGPTSSNGLYVGSFATDAAGKATFTNGGIGAGGTAGIISIWNMFNRRPIGMFVGDSTDSWTYATSNTWRAANNSAAMRVSMLCGLNEDPIDATYNAIGTPGASTVMSAGIGLNSLTNHVGSAGVISTNAMSNCIGKYTGLPGLGFNFINALECQNTATASTWIGDAVSFVGPVNVQSGLHYMGWF